VTFYVDTSREVTHKADIYLFLCLTTTFHVAWKDCYLLFCLKKEISLY
jgi:hypothetical protein